MFFVGLSWCRLWNYGYICDPTLFQWTTDSTGRNGGEGIRPGEAEKNAQDVRMLSVCTCVCSCESFHISSYVPFFKCCLSFAQVFLHVAVLYAAKALSIHMFIQQFINVLVVCSVTKQACSPTWSTVTMFASAWQVSTDETSRKRCWATDVAWFGGCANFVPATREHTYFSGLRHAWYYFTIHVFCGISIFIYILKVPSKPHGYYRG